MNHLSSRSQELFNFLQAEYIDNGYLYSGSWPYMSLLERGFSKGDMDDLVTAGLIQKRDCDGLAYELTTAEREKLMREHDLPVRWRETTGPGLFSSIEQEIHCVTSPEEKRKPSLADVITAAAKRANGATSNYITLSSTADRKWLADVYPDPDPKKFAILAREQDYPMRVLYRRNDINGSRVIEEDVCENRESLISSLCWMGQCGLVPLEMWGEPTENTANKAALAIIRDGELAAWERIEKDMDMLEAFSGDESCERPHKKPEELER